MMKLHRILLGFGLVMTGTGGVTLTSGVAGASFNGGNGDLVWSAICSGAGQQLWSAPNNASSEVCPPASPGSTAYNTTTAGAADSTPYFSADGKTIFFSSNRNGNNALYSIPYPSTVNTAAGTDNATQLTNLSDSTGYDYAPAVSADGTVLSWIHCSSINAGCSVELGQLGGPDGPVTNVQALADETSAAAAPGAVGESGDGNRPEINPGNPDQILYVDVNSNIHVASISGTGAFGPSTPNDVNVSAASLCPACTTADQGAGAGAVDEHPDWAPDGSGVIVYDSSRLANYTAGSQAGHIPFTMRNLSSAHPEADPVWNSIPTSQQNTSFVEPVYAPTQPGLDYNPTPGAGGHPPMLAWIAVKSGSNVVVEDGNIASGLNTTAVTGNRTNNAEVIWQPLPPSAQLPESPLVVGLPIGAGAILLGAGLVARRRSRSAAAI